MRRTETPPDGDPNRALTSLPDDLADSHYRAVVLEVRPDTVHERLADYVGTAPRHLDSTPSFNRPLEEQKNAYRRLDRRLDPLVERGFVSIHRKG